ncbi:(2Fe-2S) ferredoxin domain-containing protein [Acidihalobacter ferrooxydans]|uniref:2Fe-2S ferredoxin n=1 Tax=Acidihalobacter ferrooxydans TaxID=1765967 RepID=A0A1P8UJX0_9GAMM|nr:2Fe-2S ferredoxin [Acidihalobacter ferrooxydans]APZ44133.1 2Fe-2S ferredoxin [Acidihalobacter ferrooxydans]
MAYYERHAFFCTNQREDKACCQNHDASALRAYAKERTKALRISGAGRVRVNIAGCLGRCEEGPIVVVYPEGVWYTYRDRADVDEIVEEHLLHGRVVERLKLD